MRKVGDSPGREEGISRRSFLGYITGAVVTLIGAVVAVPVIGGFISPALKKTAGGTWEKLGPLGKFAVDEPKIAGIALVKKDGWVETRTPRLVWVIRTGERSFKVYNAQCTHLGCIVDYIPENKTFNSPCHGGVFAAEDGRVLEGPPPRPLDTLDYKIEVGEIWVKYQDFRMGIPEKISA